MTKQPDRLTVALRHGRARAAWQELVFELARPDLVAAVDRAGEVLMEALAAGHRLWVVGNGGSAAMASHVAAEFAGRCIADREPLPAMSLADSSPAVTAIANDYGFEHVFARAVRAMGRTSDVLLAMSTSGTSPNIVNALAAGRELGLVTVLLTGRAAPSGIQADYVLRAPTDQTPRIQEVHLLWTHAWCEAVDTAWASLS